MSALTFADVDDHALAVDVSDLSGAGLPDSADRRCIVWPAEHGV
jgi:hypothetical protein